MTLRFDPALARGDGPVPARRADLLPAGAADAAEIACDAPCPRARAEARLVGEICADAPARLALAVARYVAAARATGETDCIEAAFAEAEATLPAEEASLLVGALAGLVRALEAESGRALSMLPASCCRASADETRLAGLVSAHRAGRAADVAQGRVGRTARSVAALLGPEIVG
ncbi:hypothetical protein [Salinarimonas ramus]|uniref:Uncharacterized protein n=1 Tax=Salinarimonas ramus TaxID=690164 RepID=A0A917QEQ1_9HYPH|nr:hypothetical protein [Salinarimonas ramus]GGK45294.1 hypothetical protein GCM10011322_35610 [Salinarimonas ramus]